MTHQTETTRELSLVDLDRVSGAGLGIPQHPDAVGPEYAGRRGIVGPDIAGVRGIIGPEI